MNLNNTGRFRDSHIKANAKEVESADQIEKKYNQDIEFRKTITTNSNVLIGENDDLTSDLFQDPIDHKYVKTTPELTFKDLQEAVDEIGTKDNHIHRDAMESKNKMVHFIEDKQDEWTPDRNLIKTDVIDIKDINNYNLVNKKLTIEAIVGSPAK